MTHISSAERAERGHPVWAEIDLGALRHNVGLLRAAAPGAEVMGVVKGYAYGHGNPECARAMLEAGATRLGVARVAEAIHLREAGIDAPIHVLSEPPTEACQTMVDLGLIATIYTRTFAAALDEAAQAAASTAVAHLKIDTGMHRVGVQPDDAADVARTLLALGNLRVEGAWSHFAVADTPGHPFTKRQLELFAGTTERLEAAGLSFEIKHIANSAATLSSPESHFDLVRCGIASYGLSPGREIGRGQLRPVLSLKARVTQSKMLPAGEALSYGLRYELARQGNVITIGAGYADGYDRRLSGVAPILVEGRRFVVSGTVCMDQVMVDVGELEAEPGTVVSLLGRDGEEEVTAEELADLIGTINYEVTTRIPSRVPRLYVGGEDGGA